MKVSNSSDIATKRILLYDKKCPRKTVLYGTAPKLVEMFCKIDSTLTNKVIPALVGKPISDEDRDWFSLPLMTGGLNIQKPTDHSED